MAWEEALSQSTQGGSSLASRAGGREEVSLACRVYASMGGGWEYSMASQNIWARTRLEGGGGGGITVAWEVYGVAHGAWEETWYGAGLNCICSMEQRPSDRYLCS